LSIPPKVETILPTQSKPMSKMSDQVIQAINTNQSKNY